VLQKQGSLSSFEHVEARMSIDATEISIGLFLIVTEYSSPGAAITILRLRDFSVNSLWDFFPSFLVIIPSFPYAFRMS
jgi:hypothetical protein